MNTPGGKQRLAIINESGLYKLILRSDKPKAALFRDWLTATVLPTIRKEGATTAPTAPVAWARG